MQDKKRILFVSNPMNVGGVEKSLLSLFHYLEDKPYEVSFMPYSGGEAKWNRYIPDNVRIVKPPEYLEMMQMYRDKAWKYVVKNMVHPKILFRYAFYIVKGLMARNMERARQEFWVKCRNMLPPVEGTYDVAVAWQGEVGSYFVVDKVNASRKISWYHGIYLNHKRDREIDEEYWNQLDAFVCVTEQAAESISEAIPSLSRKIRVCHNIVSREMIYRLAEAYPIEQDENSLKLLSVGRLDPCKGFDMALQAAGQLKANGVGFAWRIVGGGNKKIQKEYTELIEKLKLNGYVYFVGELDNPYPYFKWCDIFVLTSRAETKPLVIDEAKLFCKPIVSTNFSTVYDQIEDGVNGKIVDMNASAIAEGIMEMDEKMRNCFAQNLKKENLEDGDEVLKILGGIL